MIGQLTFSSTLTHTHTQTPLDETFQSDQIDSFAFLFLILEATLPLGLCSLPPLSHQIGSNITDENDYHDLLQARLFTLTPELGPLLALRRRRNCTKHLSSLLPNHTRFHLHTKGDLLAATTAALSAFKAQHASTSELHGSQLDHALPNHHQYPRSNQYPFQLFLLHSIHHEPIFAALSARQLAQEGLIAPQNLELLVCYLCLATKPCL